MDLPKNTNLKQLAQFDSFTFEEKCINIIASDIGHLYPLEDRFGIFNDYENETLSLSELITEKSFDEITDLTAKTYANKNVAVCWSGGIDSSLIVAALYKNNIDFKVTVMHEACQAENPEMYEWVLKNCNIIELDKETTFNNLYDHIVGGGSIVSGDPADQLFPSIRYNLIPGVLTQKGLYDKENGYGDNIDFFNQPYPDEFFYNNIKERIEFNCKFVGEHFSVPDNFSQDVVNYFNEKMLRNQINFKHFYQLKWLVKFIFKYSKNLQRLKTKAQHMFIKYGREVGDFTQYDFFDTIDYQSWAWTNLDKNFETQSISALTYKMDAKKYIANVTGSQSQLNLIKVPSL